LQKFYIFAFLAILTYCSSGDYRADRFDSEKGNPNPGKISPKDKDIEEVFKIRPALKFPFKLGVYLSERSGYGWKFTEKDREEIISIGEELKKKGIISSLFFISQNIISNQSNYPYNSYSYRGNLDSLRNIRLAAARYNADAVLVLDPGVHVSKYANPLSVFYLTIVGLWVAPGNSREAHFSIYSSLWDTRTEFLFLTSEVEGIAKIFRPYAILEDSDAVESAKEKAVQNFKKEIVDSMGGLK